MKKIDRIANKNVLPTVLALCLSIFTATVSSIGSSWAEEAATNRSFFDLVGNRPATMLDIGAAAININIRTHDWPARYTFHASSFTREVNGDKLSAFVVFSAESPAGDDCLDLWEEVRLVVANASSPFDKNERRSNLCSSFELLFTPLTSNPAELTMPSGASPCAVTDIFVAINVANTLDRVSCMGEFMAERDRITVKNNSFKLP